MNDDIHILISLEYFITFCGKVKASNFVTIEFNLPTHIMCKVCVDEWENEDIRMKSKRIGSVHKFEKKYFPKQYEESHKQLNKTTKLMDRNKKD